MPTFLGEIIAPCPHLGLCVMYPAPGVIERIGPDWDWIWLDGQHGELGISDWLPLVRACDYVRRPAFLRVPGHEPGLIGLALDTGVAGVIVPCIDDRDEAEAVVRAAKFPPMGERSYGGRRPIDLQGRNYSETANRDVLLIAQVETPRALENIDDIASTPGIDAVFIGPDDLFLRRGHSMTAPRDRMMLEADFRTFAERAHFHGKLAITVAASPDILSLCVECQFDLVVAAGDVGFLASGSSQAAAAARAILQSSPRQGPENPPSLY